MNMFENKVTPSSAIPSMRRSSSLDKGMIANIEAKMKNMADLDEIDEKHKGRLETLRLATNNFLENTLLGQTYSQLLLIISVLSSFEFIYQTYLHGQSAKAVSWVADFSKLELGIAGLFLFDWLLQLFASANKGTYLIRYDVVLNLLADCL